PTMKTVTVSSCARKRSITISETSSRYEGNDDHPASPWIFMYDQRLSRSSEMLASGFLEAETPTFVAMVLVWVTSRLLVVSSRAAPRERVPHSTDGAGWVPSPESPERRARRRGGGAA